MRAVVTCILSVFLFCIESTILNKFSIRGITPNLLLAFVVSVSLLRGSKKGALIGGLIGALQDLLFYPYFGFQTLFYIYLGLTVGYFNKDFYKDNYVLPIILISITDFIYGIVMYIFLFLFHGSLNVGTYMGNIIIPEVIYTVIVGLFVYRIMLFVNDYFDRKEKHRFRKVG